MKFLIVYLIFLASLNADIQIIKQEHKDTNRTLLVIGGIHGNEPGGYFAPAILATHYKISSHNLWVIPNLNKASIQAGQRGINGDMNRKFAYIKKGDKDAQTIKDIKKIITDKRVSLILNLHDGHGFYRKDSSGKVFNPKAWGQTCVIDQCKLLNEPFGNLDTIASSVTKIVNQKLILPHHSFNVKNTKTKLHDEDMQQSLTYFAIKHSKPAFAIESSKNLSSVSQKVFYQLLAIEEFMKIMDIKFTRDFKLNIKSLDKILNNYGTLSINGNIMLKLSNIQSVLRFIPLKSKNNKFVFSHLVGSVKKTHGKYIIFIGNKKITTLKPQYFKPVKDCVNGFRFQIDGKIKLLKKASYFFVNDDFKVIKQKGYRVNVIGYTPKNGFLESGAEITLQDLNKAYSIDKAHKAYRVEFYKKDKFCSMFVVQFK